MRGINKRTVWRRGVNKGIVWRRGVNKGIVWRRGVNKGTVWRRGVNKGTVWSVPIILTYFIAKRVFFLLNTLNLYIKFTDNLLN